LCFKLYWYNKSTQSPWSIKFTNLSIRVSNPSETSGFLMTIFFVLQATHHKSGRPNSASRSCLLIFLFGERQKRKSDFGHFEQHELLIILEHSFKKGHFQLTAIHMECLPIYSHDNHIAVYSISFMFLITCFHFFFIQLANRKCFIRLTWRVPWLSKSQHQNKTITHQSTFELSTGCHSL
jgi:hypothetical protein